MNQRPEGFYKYLQKYCTYIDRLHNNLWPKSPHVIKVIEGKRFLKVVRVVQGQSSLHSFIELATGDVYKAASYKAPAKHVRGTIMTDETLKYGVNHFGVNCLIKV